MRTEDALIIQECLNGESEAFGILVDKYKAGIYAYVYAKLGNLHDSEDATQEVFLSAYRSLKTLRRWESFSFWLYRIARNVCGNRIRTQSKRPDSEFVEDQDAAALRAFSMNSHRENQVDESLRESLSVLSEGYREVLMLHYFGGMKSADIARSIGISPTAVRKRLSRARAQLREEMVTMMDTAFEGQKLPVTFTFRVVESIKNIKINPMPRMAGLPLGLSLAMGIIITVMSLNPQVNILNDIAIPAGAPLPVEMKTLKVGEMSVDILKTAEMAAIASKQEDDNGGEPKNSLMLAPAAEGGTWTKREDMPTALCLLSTSVINGKIYAIGGYGGLNFFSTVEEYDPATGKWTKKADMPTTRGWLSTSMVNGKIYAIGGAPSWGHIGLSTVEEYDPVTDKWTQKADMPTIRYGHTSSVVNGKIYVIGGVTVWSVLSAVEEYDPATDKWTKKANIPTSTGVHSASELNGKIYVIGGRSTPLNNGVIVTSSTVAEYDPATDTWARKADMPIARGALSTSMVNGKIYAIGGAEDAWRGNALSSVEEYDPVTDTWTRKSDMPTARFFIASSVVNDKIYVIGGVDSWAPPGDWVEKPLSTVEEYTPEGWSVSPQSKLPAKWGKLKQR